MLYIPHGLKVEQEAGILTTNNYTALTVADSNRTFCNTKKNYIIP